MIASRGASGVGCGPGIDVRSTSSRATVLPSSFSSRWVVVVLVTVTTGSSARGATRSPIRDATGPSGSSHIRCGRAACQPITGWLVAVLPVAGWALARVGRVGVLAVGGAAGKQQFAASWPARVFKGQPGSVQPPVEGVEPGPAAGGGLAAAVGDDVEGGAEGLEHSGNALVPRALVVSRGNETRQARGHRATPLPAM